MQPGIKKCINLGLFGLAMFGIDPLAYGDFTECLKVVSSQAQSLAGLPSADRALLVKLQQIGSELILEQQALQRLVELSKSETPKMSLGPGPEPLIYSRNITALDWVEALEVSKLGIDNEFKQYRELISSLWEAKKKEIEKKGTFRPSLSLVNRDLGEIQVLSHLIIKKIESIRLVLDPKSPDGEWSRLERFKAIFELTERNISEKIASISNAGTPENEIAEQYQKEKETSALDGIRNTLKLFQMKEKLITESRENIKRAYKSLSSPSVDQITEVENKFLKRRRALEKKLSDFTVRFHLDDKQKICVAEELTNDPTKACLDPNEVANKLGPSKGASCNGNN
jgi:hypothetical protein